MIRRFSFLDLDRVLEIERQAFPKSPYNWATFVNLQWLYPETFLVYVEKIPPEEEAKIWGYITFSEDGHIISIAVHPERRRQGIGKILVGRVITAPRVKKVWGEVRRSNAGAQAFYRSLGFAVVGMTSNYYGNEDALIMERLR